MFKMLINIIRLALIAFVVGAGALVWRGIHTVTKEEIHADFITVNTTGDQSQYAFAGEELVDGINGIIFDYPEATAIKERRIYNNGDILEWAAVEDGRKFRYGVTVPIIGRVHFEWTVNGAAECPLESL